MEQAVTITFEVVDVMHNVHAHSFGVLMSLVFWFDWLVEILQGGRDWQQQQLQTTNRPN